jgi:hypothetical protein
MTTLQDATIEDLKAELVKRKALPPMRKPHSEIDALFYNELRNRVIEGLKMQLQYESDDLGDLKQELFEVLIEHIYGPKFWQDFWNKRFP